MKGNIVEPSPVANPLPEQEEELIAELGPGDSFGEEAILSLAESDRTLAEANDVIRGLYHITRKYSSKRTSSTLEFLVVRDPRVPSTLLQYGVGEMRMRSLLTMDALKNTASLRSELQYQWCVCVFGCACISCALIHISAGRCVCVQMYMCA